MHRIASVAGNYARKKSRLLLDKSGRKIAKHMGWCADGGDLPQRPAWHDGKDGSFESRLLLDKPERRAWEHKPLKLAVLVRRRDHAAKAHPQGRAGFQLEHRNQSQARIPPAADRACATS